MELFAPITQMASAFREFVAPRYRPELYYMRGPGPAFERRMRMLQPRLQRSPFGGDMSDATSR